jgi:hypothetical protein
MRAKTSVKEEEKKGVSVSQERGEKVWGSPFIPAEKIGGPPPVHRQIASVPERSNATVSRSHMAGTG